MCSQHVVQPLPRFAINPIVAPPVGENNNCNSSVWSSPSFPNLYNVSHISHQTPPCLYRSGVAASQDLAETFPSFPVGVPLLPDVPGFQVLLTVSFHRNFGFPLGRFPSIFISKTARMFSEMSVSSLLLTCPNLYDVVSIYRMPSGSPTRKTMRCLSYTSRSSQSYLAVCSGSFRTASRMPRSSSCWSGTTARSRSGNTSSRSMVQGQQSLCHE